MDSDVTKRLAEALRKTLPCFDDRAGSPEVRRVYEEAMEVLAEHDALGEEEDARWR